MCTYLRYNCSVLSQHKRLGLLLHWPREQLSASPSDGHGVARCSRTWSWGDPSISAPHRWTGARGRQHPHHQMGTTIPSKWPDCPVSMEGVRQTTKQSSNGTQHQGESTSSSGIEWYWPSCVAVFASTTTVFVRQRSVLLSPDNSQRNKDPRPGLKVRSARFRPAAKILPHAMVVRISQQCGVGSNRRPEDPVCCCNGSTSRQSFFCVWEDWVGYCGYGRVPRGSRRRGVA